MTDPHVVDLRAYGPRLLRFATAIIIGAAVTTPIMLWIASVSGEPHADPVSGSMAWLIGICIFVLSCAGAARAIAMITRRRKRTIT